MFLGMRDETSKVVDGNIKIDDLAVVIGGDGCSTIARTDMDDVGRGDLASDHANACSRPPDPMTRIRSRSIMVVARRSQEAMMKIIS